MSLPADGRDPTDIKPLSDTIYGFRGNYFILAFLGFFTIFPILVFFVVYDGGLLFSAILFGAGTFAYWKWFQTPRTIVSATRPPDVAPLAKPISGNMRIDIQRREVVRRQKTVGGDLVHLTRRLDLLQRKPNFYLNRPHQQREHAEANYRRLIYELDEPGSRVLRDRGLPFRTKTYHRNFAHELMVCRIMAPHLLRLLDAVVGKSDLPRTKPELKAFET